MKTLQVHEQLSFDFKTDVMSHQDYLIKGELITANLVINPEQMFDKDENALKAEIKKRLAKMIADQIMEKISFSYTYNHLDQTRKYIGRVFLTPSDQVQIIRKLIER